MKLRTKRFYLIGGFTFALLCSVNSISAQTNRDVCRVTTHTWSVPGGYGTGIYEIGKFSVDDFEDGAKREFRYETDRQSYIIDVAVEYGDYKDVEKGKPIRILLSLRARIADEKQTDTAIQPVVAEATYRYKFGTIAVGKNVVTGDVSQKFELTCSDGISKGGLQRDESGQRKRI